MLDECQLNILKNSWQLGLSPKWLSMVLVDSTLESLTNTKCECTLNSLSNPNLEEFVSEQTAGSCQLARPLKPKFSVACSTPELFG